VLHWMRPTGQKYLGTVLIISVEPVFGILKSVLGFRQFLLHGEEKVGLEWTLLCTAYNFKRLHRLGGFKLAVAG